MTREFVMNAPMPGVTGVNVHEHGPNQDCSKCPHDCQGYLPLPDTMNQVVLAHDGAFAMRETMAETSVGKGISMRPVSDIIDGARSFGLLSDDEVVQGMRRREQALGLLSKKQVTNLVSSVMADRLISEIESQGTWK